MRLFCAILAYVVMVVVSVCAVIATADGKEHTPPKIPWYFDYPYQGKLTIKWVLPEETHEACGFKKLPPTVRSGYVQACADDNEKDPSRCNLILPINTGVYPPEYYTYLIRHEIAHCNGWNGKHNN